MVYIIDIDDTCADISERIKVAGERPDKKDNPQLFKLWVEKKKESLKNTRKRK